MTGIKLLTESRSAAFLAILYAGVLAASYWGAIEVTSAQLVELAKWFAGIFVGKESVAYASGNRGNGNALPLPFTMKKQ